jgi:creatinine amidohydrolase/Fe(II)-dependent formamide hydrolase-like protein
LSELAFDIGVSLAKNGFQVVAFVSTHGGNAEPLHASANRLNAMFDPLSTLVPEGDVGPDPGSHSGEWLTSVMLAQRPDLVELEAADEAVVAEVRAASLERGAAHVERFVTAVVGEIRGSTGG